MENVISLLEGEIVKFKLNIKRHNKNKLIHIAQYYEELQAEYEKAIEVLKISSNVPVSGQLPTPQDIQWKARQLTNVAFNEWWEKQVGNLR